jgi:PIN domain
MKNKNLLLVDYENVGKVDLSQLDDSYRAIIFVGAKQNPPRASSNPATAHKFSRVDFQKIEGSGKNALDFHVAFELGRIFETAPDTNCFVLASDKGYDPLLLHLNINGLKCQRITSMAELVIVAPSITLIVCQRCEKASTIDHHGGNWCTNCGCFASPPDPNLLPSMQPGFKEAVPDRYEDKAIVAECGWCHQNTDMTSGIFDDGEWMCGNCMSRYAHN